MTLTALGLSLRDETLVKSLLSVIAGSTHATWRFVDEIDADLALCDPQSPFARVAMQKSERSGRPACVALLYGQNSAAPMMHSIRGPLRVGQLLALLDGISNPVRKSPVVAAESPLHDLMPVPASSTVTQASERWLPDVLQSLVATADPTGSHGLWRIEIAATSLYVRLPECRYVLLDPDMTTDALVDLALSARVDNVVHMDGTPSDAMQTMATARPVGALLWRIGLRMKTERAMPWLGDDVVLRLSRWPDFGYFGAQKAHLALAALLTKTRWRIDALLEASGLPLTEVQSFLSACELSGLLIVEKVAPTAPATAPSTPNRRFGVSGLFRSLRSALRMGA